jgi:hypothetical protein
MLVDEPRAPQSVYADFPVEAEPVLRKALAKNPDQRFQDATEMLDGLKALPNYDAQQERLSLLTSTVEVRGFAAGDLGQALSRPGRLPGDQSSPSQFADELTAMSGTRLWRWGVVGAVVLAVLVVGFALWMRKPTKVLAPPAPIASQPAAPVAVPPVPSPPPPVPQPAAANEPAPPQAASATANEAQPSATSGKKSKKKARLGIAEWPAPKNLSVGAPAAPPAVEPAAGKRGDKKLRKGTRGTEMSEDFE